MKVLDAITHIQAVKPSQYDTVTMVGWLSDADLLIWNEYISWHHAYMKKPPRPEDDPTPEDSPETENNATDAGATDSTGENTDAHETAPEDKPARKKPPYDPETDMGVTLLVPEPYSRLYISYLAAQIDFFNAEMDRFNASMVMFNMELNRFADWYNRTHMPKQRHFVRI